MAMGLGAAPRKDLLKTPPRAPQPGKANGGLKVAISPLTQEEERHSPAREKGAKGGTSNTAPKNWH